MLRHSRVLRFKFLSPTNYRPSRMSLIDQWHKERVELSLSGADMIETVKDYLEAREINIVSFGYLESNGDSGVITLDNFDKRIK